jgi:hypothetical protein
VSVQAFTDFIRSVTTAQRKPAKKSPVAATIGNFDKSLEGEEKGMAVLAQMVSAAKDEGFDVTIDDAIEYVRDLKTKYETDPMTAAMMDAYCNTTCHLGSVVGKEPS